MEINTNFTALPTVAQRRQTPTAEDVGVRQAQQGQDEAPIAQTGQATPSVAERKQEELEEIVDKMQESISVMQRDLNFSIHDSTGMTVVKVTDVGSGEVIRQMPTEDALALAERLDEMRSLLFEARA